MYIENQPGSIWDEKSSSSDSSTRGALYKIQTGSTSYGGFSGGDLIDYYEISPGIGEFALVVTSDSANALAYPGTWGKSASAFDIKITDQAGNVILNAAASGPDSSTDAISFISSSSTATYFVEVRNSFSDTFNYAATLVSIPDPGGPSAVITDDTPGTANASTAAVTYSVTFSEPVTGLEAADFAVTNGTLLSVSGSGTAWSVAVAPTPGVASGSIGFALRAAAVTDAEGNLNASVVAASQPLDTAAPVAPKLVTTSSFNTLVNPQVTLQTTLGNVVFELDTDSARVTVANMLAYVNTGYYDGTLFHRVVPGFVAQGGGFTTGLVPRTPPYQPIVLESNNGLLNLRGTVAMARTSAADSATSQFFVNLVDNNSLNYSSPAAPGYAVFAYTVSGMSVIDLMAQQPTTTVSSFQNVPVTDIRIVTAQQTLAGSATTNSAVFSVSGLEAGGTWKYSLDSGATWNNGSGSSFIVPNGSYGAGAIQVTQQDAAGNASAVHGAFTSALVVETTAPTVTGFLPSDEETVVAIGANIEVTFSEAVQRGAGSIVLKTADGVVVASYDAATSGNLAFAGSTLAIDPSADLSFSTGYKVEFTAGSIKDLAGNSYEGTTSYNFTTRGSGTWVGSAAGESVPGTAGNDEIDGGGGIDWLTYGSNRSAYTLVAAGNSVSVSGPDGSDQLTSVERLIFQDVRVAFDITGNAGQAYRLYQAAFDRTPDIGGLGFQMNVLDIGFHLTDIAANFIESPEFAATYGSLNNSQFVTQLYLNVLDRAPDQGGLDFHVNNLELGLPRNYLLAQFSESPENQANVIGAIQNGMVYVI